MSLLTDSIIASQHGTWIEIHTGRLLRNLKTLKQAVGRPSHVMAVIKANAYGHGILEVAKTLAGEVHYLGISSLREALELKEHEIQIPIFIFGRLTNHELPAALVDGIALSVSSFEEAKEISDLSHSLGRKTTIHIKVDTGMGRLGIPSEQAVAAIEKIHDLPNLLLEGLYTHFPTAEREDGFKEHQIFEFASIVESLRKKNITFLYRHAANSAGILKAGHPTLNLIRPGLMLYGIYPDASLKNIAEVLPILSLKSRVIAVKQLKTGESAGYGRTFIADKPTTIAVLPIGYSHGYPWAASNRSFVLHHGRKYPIAGRVSMDYVTINLGSASAHIGDEVTLIGEDHGETIRAEDLANWGGTIPYEIVTRLLPSLPRFYK